MTILPGYEGRRGACTRLLPIGILTVLMFMPPSSVMPAAGAGYEETGVTNTQTTVNNRSTGFGIDPATACSDVNQDQQITPDECQGRDWSWTTTDPQIPAPVNNQNGVGVPPPQPAVVDKNGNPVPYGFGGYTSGSSTASIGQNSDQTIVSSPHFAIRNYNKPSVTGTTATDGFSSTGNGSQRNNHNEYGFEITVDKKMDPLEPYYQRFQENYAVDSQTDVNGDLVGQASVSYEKIVTEEDPANPGVFNRYTVTGTATSGGSAGNYSSQCESGCTTDPETGWSHPWQ